MVPNDIIQLELDKATLNSIVKEPVKFPDNMKYTVCRHKYTFANYSILEDIKYL